MQLRSHVGFKASGVQGFRVYWVLVKGSNLSYHNKKPYYVLCISIMITMVT